MKKTRFICEKSVRETDKRKKVVESDQRPLLINQGPKGVKGSRGSRGSGLKNARPQGSKTENSGL